MSGSAQSVLSRANKSLKWSVLAEVCSRAASPFILVVLARLLAPEEFGVVAAATLAITFAQMLWDGGLGRALVQIEHNQQESANVVFWTNLTLGLVSFCSLHFLADQIAGLLGAPHAAPVLRVLALQTIIGSLGSVQQALCVRELEFRRLFIIRLCSVVGPGLLSIPFALAGYGVWALVAGSLFGQGLSVLLLWFLSSWRPKFSYDWVLARRLFRFGSWVLLESVGVWLITSGDNLVVSRLLGTHDLGIYRIGSALVLVIFATLLSPIAAVAFPMFSRLQSNQPELSNAFLRINQFVVVLAVAFGVGLALTGPVVAEVLFGDKWQGLGWVITMLALMQGVGWIVGLNAELYRAIGRPDVNTKLMFVQLSFYLPTYWWGASQGLEFFCMVRLAVAVAALPLHLYLVNHLIGLPVGYLWNVGRSAVVAAIGMTLVVVVWQRTGIMPGGLMSMASQITLGAGSFLSVLWLLDRSFLQRLRSVVLNKSV